MDIFEAVRAKALKSVLKPDQEYVIRYVFRWYSRTFSTPLQEVYDIPFEEVLLHYYESWFEDMDDQNRMEAIDTVLETEADRLAAKIAADAKDAEDKEFEDIAKNFSIPKPKPAIIQGDDDEPPIPQGTIEAPPPMPTELPPEFSLRFDEEELDSNLIPDDVEALNSMKQPEEDEE